MAAVQSWPEPILIILSVSENLILEEPANGAEVMNILKNENLKLNGAPGEDGLTYLFFKTFFNQISPLFMPTVIHVLKNADLFNLSNNAKGTFIDKKVVKNDRPIEIEKNQIPRRCFGATS